MFKDSDHTDHAQGKSASKAGPGSEDQRLMFGHAQTPAERRVILITRQCVEQSLLARTHCLTRQPRLARQPEPVQASVL